MKKLIFLSLILFSISGIFSACGDGCARTKEAFLQDYHKFIDDVCRNQGGESWERRDDRLRQFVRKCYPKFKNEFSVLEQGQFWWGAANYYYARYGKEALKMVTNDDLMNEVVENLKALGQNFDAAIEKISETWDGLSTGAKKWWDNITGVFQ